MTKTTGLATIFTLCIGAQAGVASADAIQILDDHSTECVQQAFDAVELPRARRTQDTYGQTVLTSYVADSVVANIMIDTTRIYPPRIGSAAPYSTISIVADITHIQERDYDYEHRRSISVTFNQNDELTRVNDGVFSHYWETQPYQYVSHGSARPELSDDQQEAIETWVNDAVETATFIFSYCQAGQIYEPRDGGAVSPPDFEALQRALAPRP